MKKMGEKNMPKQNKQKPLTYRPGWNGKPYSGDNWTIANTLTPSRKLTQPEIDARVESIRSFAKSSGMFINEECKNNGSTIFIFEGEKHGGTKVKH